MPIPPRILPTTRPFGADAPRALRLQARTHGPDRWRPRTMFQRQPASTGPGTSRTPAVACPRSTSRETGSSRAGRAPKPAAKSPHHGGQPKAPHQTRRKKMAANHLNLNGFSPPGGVRTPCAFFSHGRKPTAHQGVSCHKNGDTPRGGGSRSRRLAAEWLDRRDLCWRKVRVTNIGTRDPAYWDSGAVSSVIVRSPPWGTGARR